MKIKRYIIAALVTASCLALPFPHARAEGGIFLSATEVPLDEAVRAITRFTGENAVVLMKTDRTVSFAFEDVPGEKALAQLADQNGLSLVRGNGVAFVLERAERATVNALVSKTYRGRLISLHLDRRPVQAVAGVIGRLADRDIEYDGEKGCDVTLDLSDLPWDQVIEVLAMKCGLRTVEREGTIVLQDAK